MARLCPPRASSFRLNINLPRTQKPVDLSYPVLPCQILRHSQSPKPLFGLSLRFYSAVLPLTSVQNLHRAACLNDNLDGTMTILSTYNDPLAASSRRTTGTASPPILVSKGATSLSDYPLAPESMPGSKPRKRRVRESNTRPRLDSDSESDAPSAVAPSPIGELEAGKGTQGTGPWMARPHRAYNQWPGNDQDH